MRLSSRHKKGLRRPILSCEIPSGQRKLDSWDIQSEQPPRDRRTMAESEASRCDQSTKLYAWVHMHAIFRSGIPCMGVSRPRGGTYGRNKLLVESSREPLPCTPYSRINLSLLSSPQATCIHPNRRLPPQYHVAASWFASVPSSISPPYDRSTKLHMVTNRNCSKDRSDIALAGRFRHLVRVAFNHVCA